MKIEVLSCGPNFTPVVRVLVLLVAHLLVALNVQAQEVDAAGLYQDYCSVCHGDNGDGQSHAMQGLVPPPRDFTSLKSGIELNHERITHAIREGVPGTAMTGWKSKLSEVEMIAIARYIKSQFMPKPKSQSDSEGSTIYHDFCSVCHGDTGRGAIWATAGLNPPPVDFTNADVQTKLDRRRMIKSVSYGRPETAMTGWKNRLTDGQIETVVDYVRDNFMQAKTGEPLSAEDVVATAENTRADMTLPMPLNLVGNYERGVALYLGNCSACHGVNGDGRGPRAYFINPKPRNFLHTSSRAALNRPVLYEAIAKGRLRSEMPAWETVLDPQQLADVSEFVFQRFIHQ